MTHHAHRADKSLSRTAAWFHCVAADPCRCSGAAHGGVVHIDRCSCGASRRTESNGRHVVRGPWSAPELADRREVEVAGIYYYVQEDCSVLEWDEVAQHYSRCLSATARQRAAAVRAAVVAEVEGHRIARGARG